MEEKNTRYTYKQGGDNNNNNNNNNNTMESTYRRYIHVLLQSSGENTDEDAHLSTPRSRSRDENKPTILSETLGNLSDLNKSMLSTVNGVLFILPPPFNQHRRDNKFHFLVASFVLFIILLHQIFFNFNHVLHPLRNPNQADYALAYVESNGFFTDIPSHIWKHKKQRVKDQPKHNDGQLGIRSKFLNRNHPGSWYQHNWDAEFTCPHETKIGRVSDNSKWVCDPHRLNNHHRNNNENISDDTKTSLGDGCLVYSFGRGSPNTRSFDFAFEVELLKLLGGPGSCEIHFFDHRLGAFGGHVPNGITIHKWGLEGVVDASLSRRNFMTLKETVRHLGHEGRKLDLLRLDCEGCEWNTYQEWLNSGVTPNQIVVSLHGAPKNEDNIFEMMEANNYVIFHKEADTRYGGMWQEYGFLQLTPQFFSD